MKLCFHKEVWEGEMSFETEDKIEAVMRLEIGETRLEMGLKEEMSLTEEI